MSKDNINYIHKEATLMTKEEVEEYIGHDYSDIYQDKLQVLQYMENKAKKNGWEFESDIQCFGFWIPWQQFGAYRSEDEAKKNCTTFKDGKVLKTYSKEIMLDFIK